MKTYMWTHEDLSVEKIKLRMHCKEDRKSDSTGALDTSPIVLQFFTGCGFSTASCTHTTSTHTNNPPSYIGKLPLDSRSVLESSLLSVSEFRNARFVSEERWIQADWPQFFRAVRGKCVEFFYDRD